MFGSNTFFADIICKEKQPGSWASGLGLSLTCIRNPASKIITLEAQPAVFRWTTEYEL
jgi:hypothetical protein